jgi:catechol 2,3-dioxygenase-like lactoylglutathione lyase family enzyme
MLSYITIGANDLPASARFYTAILVPLGYHAKETVHGIEYTWPADSVPARHPAAVYLKHPFNGQPATAANGAMNAFQADTQALVRILHAAGLAAGGTDEGAPGFRADYSAHFYVAYLRDPIGNKLALFCANRAEGIRGQ